MGTRKKKHEEHENHERWLVSYADFITLLFAFFVVMYSISSVNEGKYRVLSNSMSAAFRSTTRSVQPIQVGELVRSPYEANPQLINTPKPFSAVPVKISINKPIPNVDTTPIQVSQGWGNGEAGGKGKGPGGLGNSPDVEAMASAVEGSLLPLIKKGLVNIRKSRAWLEVEINSSVLFPSGSSDLTGEAMAILSRVGGILSNFDHRIHVEGFTDNQPIRTGRFPSNWELSGARAAAVVRLFAGQNIDPSRMVSIAYGEFRPVADNATAEGRARNRRVVIVVIAGRESLDTETKEALLQQNLQAARAQP